MDGGERKEGMGDDDATIKLDQEMFVRWRFSVDQDKLERRGGDRGGDGGYDTMFNDSTVI